MYFQRYSTNDGREILDEKVFITSNRAAGYVDKINAPSSRNIYYSPECGRGGRFIIPNNVILLNLDFWNRNKLYRCSYEMSTPNLHPFDSSFLIRQEIHLL